MSNVEYRCLVPIKDGVKGRSGHYEHEGQVVCGAKLFAAPGGTNLACPQHGERYTQVEDFTGPLFEYRDEDGNVHHRQTGVRGDTTLADGSVRQDMITNTGQVTTPVNPSTTYIADEVVTNRDGDVESYQTVPVQDRVEPAPLPEDASIGQLQDIYRRETGMEPDGRWRERGLRDGIEEHRERARSMQPDPNDTRHDNLGTSGQGEVDLPRDGGDDQDKPGIEPEDVDDDGNVQAHDDREPEVPPMADEVDDIPPEDDKQKGGK